MKRLWKRLRNWLIRKLGGFTRQEVEDAVEEWSEKLAAAGDSLARLTLERDMARKKNVELTTENGRLKMELDRDPPVWKMLGGVETLVPRTLQAEWRFRQDPEAAVDMDKVAKERVTQQLLDGVRQHIHFSYDHDFFGNSRVTATLRVLMGPGEVE